MADDAIARKMSHYEEIQHPNEESDVDVSVVD